MSHSIPKTTVKFTSFPQTKPPPSFVLEIVDVFRKHEQAISTVSLEKGLVSNVVLATVAGDLKSLGFLVETGKQTAEKIDRPVFFGENGVPTRRYQIDAYWPAWGCGLEIEAGRAWLGNAVYRDLIQACVMVDVKHLCIAVANTYKYMSSGRQMESEDYKNLVSVAAALYGHSRFELPYELTVIGY